MSYITTTFLNLFYSLFKSKSVSVKQIHPTSNSQEDETANTNGSEEDETNSVTSIESPTIEKDEPDLETSIEERPEIGEKNKWLYPTGFGVMERGVVDSEGSPKKKKKKDRTIYLK
jgi:hypothetical protein